MNRTPYPRNVAGDFYVEDACCTLCGVPSYAPNFFELDERHCWVRRQAATPAEVDKMLDIIAMADLQCIRYRGNDLDLIARLKAMNEANVVDALDEEPAALT